MLTSTLQARRLIATTGELYSLTHHIASPSIDYYYQLVRAENHCYESEMTTIAAAQHIQEELKELRVSLAYRC